MNVIFEYSENNNNQTFTQQFLNYYKKGGSIHIKRRIEVSSQNIVEAK